MACRSAPTTAGNRARSARMDRRCGGFSVLGGALRGNSKCVDAAIGELRIGLERLEMLDDTVIVLTAPHGKYLGEYPAILHHHVPGETSLRVPLIVRPPAWCGIEGGRSVADVFSLVDLFPSLTEWLGLQPPAGIDGRSRAAEIAGGRRWAMIQTSRSACAERSSACIKALTSWWRRCSPMWSGHGAAPGARAMESLFP